MVLLKKNNAPKTTQMIEDDIRYSFSKITSQNNPIYSITINDTGCKTTEELRFILTNKFFNRIFKDYKNSFEKLNYLHQIKSSSKSFKKFIRFLLNFSIFIVTWLFIHLLFH